MARRMWPSITCETQVAYIATNIKQVRVPIFAPVTFYPVKTIDFLEADHIEEVPIRPIRIHRATRQGDKRVPMVHLNCGYSVEQDRLFVSMAMYFNVGQWKW